MKLWTLALRNLLRNRHRSLATLLAMVIGLTAILLFGGYRSNILYGLETGFVQHSGHLQIQRRGYFADGGDNPSAYGFASYPRIQEAITKDQTLAPLVRMTTPTLMLGGIASNVAANQTRSVLALGLVPRDFNQLTQWNAYGMVSYANPLPLEDTPDNTVTIGTGVARKLQLCKALGVPDCSSSPGAAAAAPSAAADLPADVAALLPPAAATPDHQAARRIELLVASARGAPNVASLQVAAAINQGIKAIDDVAMSMHLSQAQRLMYGAKAPSATALIVQLHDTAQLPRARERLNTLLAQEFANEDLEIQDYQTLNPIFGQTNEFMGSMFGFISLLIAVIVLFTIANTMGTAVLERTVEIGTLRAMGMRRTGILRLFLCEALLLGAFGTVLGLANAGILSWLINHSGWSWTPPGYSYAYLILVRVWQDQGLVVGSIVGLFAVTLMSAWWPARRAARAVIVDALRH